MKALQKFAALPGAKLISAPIPDIKPNEVLVKTTVASICGTDKHIYEWDSWAQNRIKVPLIFGHEFAGEVIEVGKEVHNVSVGDFISAETHVACSNCFQCLTGNAHICESVKIFGVDTQGVFAEYVAVPAANAWKNPKDLPPEIASIQEPFGNAVHTVFAFNIAAQKVLIAGCGPIGCFAVGIAKACGASKVIATDISDYRLKIAEKMGADVVINVKETDEVKEIMQLTKGRGVDIFLEMSGNADAMRNGFKVLRSGGKASILGVFSKPFEFDFTNNIVFKYVTVQGINGRLMYDTWHKTRELLENKMVDVRPVITHKFKLEEFEKAFGLMHDNNCGKIILYP